MMTGEVDQSQAERNKLQKDKLGQDLLSSVKGRPKKR